MCRGLNPSNEVLSTCWKGHGTDAASVIAIWAVTNRGLDDDQLCLAGQMQLAQIGAQRSLESGWKFHVVAFLQVHLSMSIMHLL